MFFADSIDALAGSNTDFRHVLHTGRYAQVVAMSLPPGTDIGAETHQHTDQLFMVAGGSGEAAVGNETRTVSTGDFIFVPAGTQHNIRATSGQDLKLLTIYAPPAHPDGTVVPTKEAAAG